MKLYIAGPMSGRPEFNYPEFNACETDLVANGHEVLNPARLFGGTADRPRAEYMRGGLVMLLDADGIVLLDKWHESPGAKLEFEIAEQCDMVVGTWNRVKGLTLYL